MELEFKPDFEECRGRWDAFWLKENPRPLMQLTVPKDPAVVPEHPVYLTGIFDDKFEEMLDQLLRWGEAHHFLGEDIPKYILEFGPDHFTALLGANLEYSAEQETSWAVPFVTDWADYEPEFDRNGYWWEKTMTCLEKARTKLEGRMLVAPPTILANLDCLAALRGSNDLLMDLVLNPKEIHRVLDKVTGLHDELLDIYADVLDFDTWGCINRFGGYLSKGKMCRPQSDISCTVSADMFDQFLAPYLRREAAAMDRAMYHLDGVDAIRHLDTLGPMEEIDMIQFVPGAGHYDEDWRELYDRIDSYGKGQYFYRSNVPFLKEAVTRYKDPRQLHRIDGLGLDEARRILDTISY